ncbi:hypothetical protein [Oxalicibacterium faecigallinarum]|uniref:hypothetical protein n=1 Tax=Oxalicibacterium faecigallinarum TaxID=573741 RepID=UPI0016673504|nr:hypothetical protein [Oxalicibacterium faecigallinarum]
MAGQSSDKSPRLFASIDAVNKSDKAGFAQGEANASPSFCPKYLQGVEMSNEDIIQAIEENSMPHMTWLMNSPRSTSRLYIFIASLAGPNNNFGYGPNPNAPWLAFLCRVLNKL